MKRLNRRTFLKRATVPAATLWLSSKSSRSGGELHSAGALSEHDADPPGIVDTNVHLHNWPFRRLKYDQTGALLSKLRSHRVTEAWAGSFEALLHKNLTEVNARLAEECRVNGDRLLVPFGSVNPAWPDWREDLRRCHEVYRMPGIRLYPSYHGYTFEHPEFAKLIGRATDLGLTVQIALKMEDDRVHHPITRIPLLDHEPLITVLDRIPRARIHLINSESALRGQTGVTLIEKTKAVFDISHIEGTGGLGRLIEGNHWFYPDRVPVERLLFGSHAPFFPSESALLKLFTSPLTLKQLRAIMHENAERFLNRSTA